MDLFFDSHLHGTLKNQFAASDNPTHPWDNVLLSDLIAGIRVCRCALRPFLETVIVSQSSLKQLVENNYRLVNFALFAPDRDLLLAVFSEPTFNRLITRGQLGKTLNATRFQELINPGLSRYGVLEKDLELLSEQSEGREVVFLKRAADYQPDAANKIFAVFGIEGLHCLRSDVMSADVTEIMTDILQNLDDLRSRVSVTAINLTHIDNGNTMFANQAYAMDGLRTGSGFNEVKLRPIGNGITTEGKKMAEELYKREILVDTKHMSWMSRKGLYEHLRAFRNQTGLKAPIVCSHTGFAGTWFNQGNRKFTDFIMPRPTRIGSQFAVQLAKPQAFSHPDFRGIGFNASTINLFNEDILEILQSDGLIGLSMDQRILGCTISSGLSEFFEGTLDNQDVKLLTDLEFISTTEFASISTIGRHTARWRETLFFDNALEFVAEPEFLHFLHFANHVLYAMKVANDAFREPGVRKMLTETLCIGSDYDGLIDGIDSCANTTHIASFKAMFVSRFGGLVSSAGLSLPSGLTVQQVADHLFYENGKNFTMKRLNALEQLQARPNPILEV